MNERFESIEAFYNDDERRRRSPECDYGVWWTGSKSFPRYRVSYVQATGEVYAVKLERAGEVEVLASVTPDDGVWYYQTLDRMLRGWAAHCGEPNGLAWVREKLAKED